MRRFQNLGPIISLALLAILLILPSTGSTQDISQLLKAVDKIETNLKSLVTKEAAVRSNEIKQLRIELTKLSKAISNISTPADNGNSAELLADLKVDLEWLKLEIQGLKAELSSAKLASLGSAGANSVAKASTPGPKYHNLRYKDNYSYLDNSDNRGQDIFDPLKRISLGGNTELSFGGQYRLRYESDNDRNLGASNPTSQEVYLNRMLLFSDLKVANRFRFFAEFKYAGITNNALPAPNLAHDRPDLENLFVDGWAIHSKSAKLGARFGRQELQFGKQRLISPLDWANTRRTFDGFRIMSSFSGWAIDGFITKPVDVDPKSFNTLDKARLFSGIYATKKIQKHLFSGYFLVYTKNAPVPLIAGLSGDYEYLTLGTGYDGKAGTFDWSSEMAFQFGSLGDKSISAYMIALSGGYSFKNQPMKPRVGLTWDIASGDSDPNDNTVNTFNQLFPLGHAFFGWADQVGRRNMNSIGIQLSAKPSKTVTTKLNWFSFNLMQKEDALYNAGGKGTRQDITGASGSHVGNELDALVIFKLNRHASFHLGYMHFAPGEFIENTGTAEAHNFLYIMLPIKF